MIATYKIFSNEELKYIVNILRGTMVDIGLEKGLNHEYTVKISQVLDLYLTELQNRNHLSQISTD